MKKTIICLIPARGGSKGIPGKNIIKFCKKPLISWSIEQAAGSKYIKDVFVTSDDQKILQVSSNAGAKIIKRPARLAADTSATEDALLHALDYLEQATYKKIDIVVFLQVTSPLRKSEDIDNAIELFLSQRGDSLFSGAMLDDFCAWQVRNGKFSSLTFDYRNRGRRQDKKPYYLENGSIYIFKPDILRKYHNRLGGEIVFYPMPLWQSFEIDSPEDLGLCEYYMKNKLLKKSGRRP
jgi:CMP-N,N'-diacetyllegionaminic acid synthase